MIGQTVLHYTILENLVEGGMSQNGPRTFMVSGCRFEDPAEGGTSHHIENLRG